MRSRSTGGTHPSREEWEAGLAGEEPRGCANGCLVLVVACVAIDAIIVWAFIQALSSIGWFAGWLLTFMASS